MTLPKNEDDHTQKIKTASPDHRNITKPLTSSVPFPQESILDLP